MAQEDSSKSKSAVTRALLAVLFVVVLLGGMMFYLARPLIVGESIFLATKPVDPFDPLRGQYITIRYDIGDVVAPAEAKAGDYVYVSLIPDDSGVSKPAEVNLFPPNQGSFIRGTIIELSPGRTSVQYGIEQYFFERQATFPTDNIVVEAKVDASGQARIARLYREGKPLEIQYHTEALK